MQGILLVDKPKGWTSFDAVNYVRKIVATAEGKKPKNTKVGHTGTLDPLASGLLVLLVGKDYTRRAGELSKADKTYEVTMRLGQTSTTGDGEGEKISGNGRVPNQEEVEAALKGFVGEGMQTPPQYSAIKVNGQRAYHLARQGKPVTLEPRKIIIRNIRLKKYVYPLVEFTAEVSSGTYIRSLVEDVGRALGTGAYMSDLCRTRVDEFSLTDAIAVQQLDADTVASRLQRLM